MGLSSDHLGTDAGEMGGFGIPEAEHVAKIDECDEMKPEDLVGHGAGRLIGISESGCGPS